MEREKEDVMTGKDIKKNYVFNTMAQFFSIAIPLITTPYVARVLGAEGVGIYSFTNAIISYFVLFASLGLTVYASRQVAFFQGDRKEQTKIFNEVICLKSLLMIPGMMVLIPLAFHYEKYTVYLMIGSLQLIDAVTNIDWLYVGNEDFAVTVARGIAVRLLSVVLIFMFVKDAGDLVKYVLISAGASLLSGLALWGGVKKYVDGFRPTLQGFGKHLRGGVALFLIQMATSVYMYLDKVMIGMLQGNIAENGYYEQSQKVVALSTTIITSLSTVMLPRIANAFMQHDADAIDRYMNKTMRFAISMGMAMAMGLMVCSSNIVPWFLGEEYSKCVTLLRIVAPMILFNSLYNMLGYQYLLGTKQEGTITKSVVAGSLLNFFLNLLLIPHFASLGASIASVIAEILIVGIQFYYVKQQVSFERLGKYVAKCVLASFVMFWGLSILSRHLASGIIQTTVMVVAGFCVYLLMLSVVKEDFLIPMVTDNILRRNVDGSKREGNQ